LRARRTVFLKKEKFFKFENKGVKGLPYMMANWLKVEEVLLRRRTSAWSQRVECVFEQSIFLSPLEIDVGGEKNKIEKKKRKTRNLSV